MTELIVALDVDNWDHSIDMVGKIGGDCVWYKVGAQLFTREGPPLVKVLKGLGKKVMLDLKYYDIPNQIGNAVKEAVKIGADMLTLHASGGRKMIEYALKSVEGSDTKLLAITVLTSFDRESWNDSAGNTEMVTDAVTRLARLASNSGVHGIVCSPHEIKDVRDAVEDRSFVVTPGIRPDWNLSKEDQVRVTTPRQAWERGARFIVVGRPVLEHEDPRQAVRMIGRELV